MHPTSVSHRPQTIKQAKKAYRKSGATVRLSESELAQIKRRAELQERADRIRERESKRKANLKRKEDRTHREREARYRMGASSPRKDGIHVGPSQLPMGNFLAVGSKGKKEEKPLEVEEAEPFKLEDLKSLEAQVTAMGPPPTRNPLQPKSVNSAIQQKLSMPASQLKSQSLLDESLEDFFVSNTQIERELSPSSVNPSPVSESTTRLPTSPPPPFSNATDEIATSDNATDMLAQISTQDLDFTGELTQLAPQALIEKLEFEEDFADEDLEDIVLEFELESSDPSKRPTLSQWCPSSSDEDKQECYHSDIDASHYREHNDPSCCQFRAENWNPDQAEAYALRNNFGFKDVLSRLEFEDFMARPENDWMLGDYEDYKFFVDLRQCQEAKLAAESDAFDLSTQDLQELES
ncbi:hypothetical protein MMC28_000002 [Mycoblastus sanguinarius]|nr:hypothetical protein [Mycoblastus sanguinarius]